MKDMLPVVILHGQVDTMVPYKGSVKFADIVTKRFGKDKILVYIKPGEHGFNGEVSLETSWLQDALQHVTRPWLDDAGSDRRSAEQT